MTVAKEIEDELQEGETIESAVIGKWGWDGYSETHSIPPNKVGVVLSWDEAKGLLDYEWEHGYGAPEVHAFYVWTNKRVGFVSQYDGSTQLEWIPRSPMNVMPDMPGG